MGYIWKSQEKIWRSMRWQSLPYHSQGEIAPTYRLPFPRLWNYISVEMNVQRHHSLQWFDNWNTTLTALVQFRVHQTCFIFLMVMMWLPLNNSQQRDNGLVSQLEYISAYWYMGLYIIAFCKFGQCETDFEKHIWSLCSDKVSKTEN